MLNFSKINIILIYLIFLLVSVFSFLNFQSQEDPVINKKVNLGLDLQGGSYLLLEINSDNLIEEKIQSKVIPIKRYLKENDINFKNFKIQKEKLKFKVSNLEKFDTIFFSKKDNPINPYIDNYRSFELDYNILEENNIEIQFSKFGLLTINNAALKQSIEIVRRRIDDIGTKEQKSLRQNCKVEFPISF